MSAQGGGIPRFGPEVDVNFRALPVFNPRAQEAWGGVAATAGRMLEAVSQEMLQLEAAQVKADAEVAGTAAGADKLNYDPQALPTGATLADQTFRAAAVKSREDSVKSYLAELELSREAKYTELQTAYLQTPEAQRNPVDFEKQLQTWVQSTAKAQPPDVADKFLNQALIKAYPLILDAHKDFASYTERRAKDDSAAVEDLTKRKLLADPSPKSPEALNAFNLNLAQYKKSLEGQGFSPVQMEEKMRSFFQDELQPAALMAEYYQAKDKLAYIDSLAEQPAQALGLTEEGKGKVLSKVKGLFNDAQFEEEQRYSTLNFQQKSDLAFAKGEIERLVGEGLATESELVAFGQRFQAVLKPEWLGEQRARLGGVRAKKAEADARLQATLAGDIPADQSSAETQKLLDDYFNRLQKNSTPVQGASLTGVFGEARPNHRHDGIDLAAAHGSSITSVLAGKVTYVGPRGGYGQVVEIQQADGTKARYAHTARALVKVGDPVLAQQPVALVGSTGNSTGPHLHLSIYDPAGRAIDPARYLKPTAPALNLQKQMEQAIVKTGIVPSLYQRQLVNLLHGTPQQQAEAASRYGWLVEHDVTPRGLSRQEQGFLARVHAELARGLTGAKAVEIAKLETDRRNPNLLAVNKEAVSRLLKTDRFKIENQFQASAWDKTQPFLPMTNNFKASLQADWERFVSEAHYHTGGDEQATHQEAIRQFKKLYGVTQVGSVRQFVKYPPEKQYALRGYSDEQNAAWQRRQLDQELRGQFLPAVSAKTVFLLLDPVSVRNGGRPKYFLYHKPADGGFEPLRANGIPATWAPDPAAEIRRVQAEQKRKAEAAAQTARQLTADAQAAKPKPFNMIGK